MKSFTIKQAKKSTTSSNTPAQSRPHSTERPASSDRVTTVAYFKSVKRLYARKGPLVVRLHKDGYFRRHDALPTRTLHPRGAAAVEVECKNEMRRGLFMRPVSS